jgi:hypothetical protein
MAQDRQNNRKAPRKLLHVSLSYASPHPFLLRSGFDLNSKETRTVLARENDVHISHPFGRKSGDLAVTDKLTKNVMFPGCACHARIF